MYIYVCMYTYRVCVNMVDQAPLCFPSELRVSGCYGLFIPGPNPRQVSLATVDGFSTVAVEVAHCRALDENRAVAIQVATPEHHLDDRHTREADPSELLSSPLLSAGGAVLQHSDGTEEDEGSHSDPAVLTPPAGHLPALPGSVAAHLLLQKKSGSSRMSKTRRNLRGSEE